MPSEPSEARRTGGADRSELVREMVGRWNAGSREVADLASFADPEIELESPFSAIGGEAYDGYAGLDRWMREIDEQCLQSGGL